MPAPTRNTLRSTPNLGFILGLALAGSLAGAQPIDIKPIEHINIQTTAPAQVYQNQMVIRVRTTSKAQLDAMIALTESVWSERVGVGSLDIQIKASNLSAITKLGIPHEILIADLQAHTNTRWNQIVVQDKIDQLEQRDANDHQRGTSVHDDAWFANYKQLADIIAYYNNIAAQRPDLASMADIGDTEQANDIFALTLTAPDEPGNLAADRPVVLWHGATHAREWISPMTVAYLASKFADDYDTDPRVNAILKSARIVIVPVTNPDGYLYTWSNERFWRKNRHNNGNGTFGVDINRNWGYQWGGQGASTNTSDDTYRGTGPFSELENQTLRDLAMSFGSDLVAHIDYHSYSQLVLWPFGYASGVQTPEPDRTFFDTLSTDLSNEILSYSGVFYTPMQSVDLYPAAGDSSDWFYGELDAKSLTIELRPNSGGFDGFDPPPSTILPTAQENYEAAKLFVERTTQRLNLSADPIATVQANEPTPVTLSVSDGIETQDTASATLQARIGSVGSFSAIPMTNTAPGVYIANLPPAACDSQIEYYFQASTLAGSTLSFPADGASAPMTALAQEITLAYQDQMETDTGWIVGAPSDTATTGIWNRMDPQSTAAQPEDDHTPAGTDCWITDGVAGSSLGSRDIDGGATTLTSPMLDAIAAGDDAELVYARWYSNNAGASPDEDSMLVELSNDNGNSWTTLETVTENANQWVEKRFRIADTILPTDQMRLRFVASDLFNGSIVEAGVDDLRIEAVGCTTNPADLNGDGTLDFFDISLFLSAFSTQAPIADFNNDGQWDFFDVSAFLTAFNNG
ncbi:MAG: M14 family zinc carboxypeptidase [Phycisphaerales bacterium]